MATWTAVCTGTTIKICGINLHVASLLRGQSPEGSLVRKFNDVNLDVDPNANITLRIHRGVADVLSLVDLPAIRALDIP